MKKRSRAHEAGSIEAGSSKSKSIFFANRVDGAIVGQPGRAKSALGIQSDPARAPRAPRSGRSRPHRASWGAHVARLRAQLSARVPRTPARRVISIWILVQHALAPTAVRRIFYAPRMPPTPQSRKCLRKFSKKTICLTKSAQTCMKRNVGELEIYLLSNFQLRTTFGGRKNVEKAKQKNFEKLQTLNVRLASNFGKMRFRRSPTFHFSRSKTFFGGAKQIFLDDPAGGGGGWT